jgi:hypothetical protein
VTDFKVGDKVMLDPALVCGGARRSRGTGTVVAMRSGGTRAYVRWASRHDGGDTLNEDIATWELVLVSNPKEAA